MKPLASATFSEADLQTHCDTLAALDHDLAAIIRSYGYPPFWHRPNTFETLVHIILEQQVSLASAQAALEKLREHCGEITPRRLLEIPDDQFKSLYVSRQKRTYIQGLAHALLDSSLNLTTLSLQPALEVRKQLTRLKGIGDWTVDIYLLMVLHHKDIFPAGDIAVITMFKRVKHLPTASREEVIDIAAQWSPHRSVATMVLWHGYLSERKS